MGCSAGIDIKFLLDARARKQPIVNISATNTRIFMKSYVVVNYYLVSLSFKFPEDSCINARA